MIADVVIVGAGLAGSAAAVLLGRAGLQVVLVERSPRPDAHKVLCTHAIQSSALPTLTRLGLGAALDHAGAARSVPEVWTRYGWIRRPGAAPGYGYNVRRAVLDPLLRARAAATPGVALLAGHELVELVARDGQVTDVRVRDSNGGERLIAARAVIGADGRSSRTATLAGLDAKLTPNQRFGYYAYYRGLDRPRGDNAQVWFLDPDMAYAFPTDDGLTLIAVMPTKARLDEFRADLGGAFARMVAALPDGPRLAAGARVGPLRGFIDLPNARRPAARGNVALIGDAALAADPVWGVGCGWALQSAEWLADAIDPATRRGSLAGGLARYARRHARALRGHRWMIDDYSSGRRFNPAERLLFSAAATDPVVAEHVHAFASREIAALALLSPRIMLRAAWRRLIKPSVQTALLPSAKE